jgi:hypothetical protein
MLSEQLLKANITQAVYKHTKNAAQRAMMSMQTEKSEAFEMAAENFAETFAVLLAEPLATEMASAIYSFVKNAEIYGTLITTGSPAMQTVVVNSTPVPVANGAVPQTLGIR